MRVFVAAMLLVIPVTAKAGLYAGLAAGDQFSILSDGTLVNRRGIDAEAKLGYGFDVPVRLYLSGSIDSVQSHRRSVTGEMLTGLLEWHVFLMPDFSAYLRAGAGVGTSKDLTVDARRTRGPALIDAVGVEVKLRKRIHLSVELFCKYLGGQAVKPGDLSGVYIAGAQTGFSYD